MKHGLRRRGWVDGENLHVIRRQANWQVERLPALARELVDMGVDAIAALGQAEAMAAAHATKTIPIVFINVAWPVEMGLVQSLARPGGNITGRQWYAGLEVTVKLYEFIKAFYPGIQRISWMNESRIQLLDTMSGGRLDYHEVFAAAARPLGLTARYHALERQQDIDRVIADMVATRSQFVLAEAGYATYEGAKRIAERCLELRLPCGFDQRLGAEAGALFSYGPAMYDVQGRERYLDMIDKVLRGVLPADIPVELPNLYELVVNLKTAKALGVTVPAALLARADVVIE
jgi:putative ABC transport system substrate-binding protein